MVATEAETDADSTVDGVTLHDLMWLLEGELDGGSDIVADVDRMLLCVNDCVDSEERLRVGTAHRTGPQRLSRSISTAQQQVTPTKGRLGIHK